MLIVTRYYAVFISTNVVAAVTYFFFLPETVREADLLIIEPFPRKAQH